MAKQKDIFDIVDRIADDLIKNPLKVYTSEAWKNKKYSEMLSAGVSEDKVQPMLDSLIEKAGPIAEKRAPIMDAINNEKARVKNMQKSAATFNSGETVNAMNTPIEPFNPQSRPRVYEPSATDYNRGNAGETITNSGINQKPKGMFYAPTIADKPSSTVNSVYRDLAEQDFLKKAAEADYNEKAFARNEAVKSLPNRNITNADSVGNNKQVKRLGVNAGIYPENPEARAASSVGKELVPYVERTKQKGGFLRNNKMDVALEEVLRNSPKLAKAAKGLGLFGAAVGLGQGVKDVYDAPDEDKAVTAAKLAGSTAGGWAGFNAAAPIGASILSPLGPYGVIAGGALAGTAGAMGGGYLVDQAIDWLSKKQPPEKKIEERPMYTDAEIAAAKAAIEEEDRLKEKEKTSGGGMKHKQIPIQKYTPSGFIEYGNQAYENDDVQR